MSQFLGTTSGTNGLGIQCIADDNRLWPQWADGDESRHIPLDEVFGFTDFRNGWWPRGYSLDATGDDMLEAIRYDDFEITNGQKIQYGLVGTCRDRFGSPVAGATVILFRTSDDLKVDKQITDSSGYYELHTPYFNDAHYIVEYKAGAGIVPDIFGASLNTLIAG